MNFDFFLKLRESLMITNVKNGSLVKFPFRLSDYEYDAVKDIMECGGGTWREKDQGFFFFMSDADAKATLNNLTEPAVDLYLKENEFRIRHQFYETPVVIASIMTEEILRWLPNEPYNGEYYKLLEPSAGCGILAANMIDRMNCENARFNVTVIEPELKNYIELRELICGRNEEYLVTDYNSTFEYYTQRIVLDQGNPYFDAVVMNPPFFGTLGLKHIMTAYQLLAPSGVLVALASSNSLLYRNPTCDAFRLFLETHGATVTELPYGCFRSSGTQTDISMIVMRKF